MELWVWNFTPKYIPKSDIVFATSRETAEYLMKYRNELVCRKLYLIQHYESWDVNDEERLIATWKSPLEKIVIAPWLKDIATNLGEHAELIENGFDFDYFRLKTPIEERNPYQLCMLYHVAPWKGFDDGFSAIAKAREIYPQIRLNLFGVCQKPKNLPNWVEYYKKPDRILHNGLYNESSIFVGASHMEGWGLTVGEAMQCGCAVVCTNNDGYLIMARQNETALVSPIKTPDDLAKNIIWLIENNELRFALAHNGNNMIKRYTWENAYGKLINIIEDERHI